MITDKFDEYMKQGLSVQEASCLAEAAAMREHRRANAECQAECSKKARALRDMIREQELEHITVRY